MSENPAFCGLLARLRPVSKFWKMATLARISRKSPTETAETPVLGRLSPETNSDPLGGGLAGESAMKSTSIWRTVGFAGWVWTGGCPDHSTFSKNRHGRFRESDLFRRVVEIVLRRCIRERLVGGEGFAVDASLIKATPSRRRGSKATRGFPRTHFALLPNDCIRSYRRLTPPRLL
jgi:hypothetical protein